MPQLTVGPNVSNMGSFSANYSLLWMFSGYLFLSFSKVEGGGDLLAGNGAPKLLSLNATCGVTSIHVNLSFERPFDGIIYSKGAFYTPQCVFVLPGTKEKDFSFDIPINACETVENKPDGDEKYGERSFENTVVMQNDAHFQDSLDVVRRIRCVTASKYEKVVDFLPINVNMKDVVTASFTGDDVKVSIDVQNGRGPFAPSLNQGFIQIGDTVTLVVYMTAQSAVWDLHVRECVALDSQERTTLQLQDKNGCVRKPKILTPFAFTQDRKNSDVLIAYSYMKAFRFPDDMQVQIKCVVAVCRDECQKIDHCNGTRSIPSAAPETSMDEEDGRTATTETPQLGAGSTSSGWKHQNPVMSSRPTRTLEFPVLTSFLRKDKREAGVENPAMGTLPLKRIFNVISPEDIANLKNSSVVFVSDSLIPANSLCVNQVMFILLLVFLFGLIMSTSVALTVTCLRNRALRKVKVASGHDHFDPYVDCARF